jgi:hypothetical protein
MNSNSNNNCTIFAVTPRTDYYQFNSRKIAEYSRKVGGRELTEEERELFRVWPKPIPLKWDSKRNRAFV